MRPVALLSILLTAALLCPAIASTQSIEDEDKQAEEQRRMASQCRPQPTRSMLRRAMPWLRRNLQDPTGARIVKCGSPEPANDCSWEFTCVVLARDMTGELTPRRWSFVFLHGRFVEGSPWSSSS